jgi:uncharacterized protein YdeI (YjbR/CyaY-like superfamily)
MSAAAAALPPDAFEARTRVQWRRWLQGHHVASKGVWLVTFKKGSGQPQLVYGDAVEEALAFGWVDSKPRKLDDARSMLWFAPRKAGSGWSRPNKERIARLQAAGLMAPAGQAVVDAARADGSWSRLDAVEDGVVPADLAAALAALPGAAPNFDAFPRSSRRGILEWIEQARTAATRDKRVRETARLAAINERANQWRRQP